MKPVAIFRHSPTEGPGYFATYLDARGIPWRLVKIDEGAVVPPDPRAYGGLVFMGGPMSVNDDLPWIAAELQLIRAAVDADVPALGHCLGGQLMAKALGGVVARNPVKEIGWGETSVVDIPSAQLWFGHVSPSFLSFHWHGETFTVPPGAERILSTPYCENQGFVLGNHLAMQCHIEMTREMIESWCASGGAEIRRSNSPAVQPVEEIMQNMERRLTDLHQAAAGVYQRWIEGLKK